MKLPLARVTSPQASVEWPSPGWRVPSSPEVATAPGLRSSLSGDVAAPTEPFHSRRARACPRVATVHRLEMSKPRGTTVTHPYRLSDSASQHLATAAAIARDMLAVH